MIQTKSLFLSGVVVVAIIVGTVTALSIGIAPNAVAQQNQTTADPEQIKNYLTQAIQAMDSGNMTMAAEQIGLAEEQLEGMTGTEVEYEDEGTEVEDEDEGEEEEGEVEDETEEPGDVDTQ